MSPKDMLDNLHPAQRKFFLDQRKIIPQSTAVTKPTREIPAETIAFLRECCK